MTQNSPLRGRLFLEHLCRLFTELGGVRRVHAFFRAYRQPPGTVHAFFRAYRQPPETAPPGPVFQSLMIRQRERSTIVRDLFRQLSTT